MATPRILLFGKDGQLGWALQRALARNGEVIACGRNDCDLTDAEHIRAVVRAASPAVIVNAAAYTAVDRAENEPELAHQVNAAAPGILAEEAERAGALLIHYSTDYVFDGEKQAPYLESDPPGPLNIYGQSKLAGEQAVQSAGGMHLIFRTSWLYGPHGSNFPKTILALAAERDSLRVVADQFGAPTSVHLVAEVTSSCLNRWLAPPSDRGERLGLFHLAASGETSWHGLACELVRAAATINTPLKLSPDRIEPIAAHEYPVAAKRPANSRLDTGKLTRVFGLQLPPWRDHIHHSISEMVGTRP